MALVWGIIKHLGALQLGKQKKMLLFCLCPPTFILVNHLLATGCDGHQTTWGLFLACFAHSYSAADITPFSAPPVCPSTRSASQADFATYITSFAETSAA